MSHLNHAVSNSVIDSARENECIRLECHKANTRMSSVDSDDKLQGAIASASQQGLLSSQLEIDSERKTEIHGKLTRNSQRLHEDILDSVSSTAVESEIGLVNQDGVPFAILEPDSDLCASQIQDRFSSCHTTTCNSGSSKDVVRRVIILQPGDDPEKVTADVIKQITSMLDKEAEKELAEGRTPERETVIEITGIRAQPETCILPRGDDQPLAIETSPRLALPQEQKTRRRKSAHSKHYMYHSPAPAAEQKFSSGSSKLTNADCYFQHQTYHCSSYRTASSRLLGRSPVIQKPGSMQSGAQSKRQKPAILRSAHWTVSTGINRIDKKTVPTSSQSSEKQNTVNKDSLVTENPMADSSNSKQPLAESTGSVTSDSINDGNKPNQSLANIQWLGKLPPAGVNPYKVKDTQLSTTGTEKVCVHKKRPPFSYMNLILMAICDDPNRRKTLKQIYQWIEERFPYYKCCANPSWKNSIRQNLSLCDIFVNEKPQGKSGRSYWRLNSKLPLASNYIQNSQIQLMNSLTSTQDIQPDSRHICPKSHPTCVVGDGKSAVAGTFVTKQSTTKKIHNKTPVPLLPKVTHAQAYAQLPVHSVIPVFMQPAVLVSSVSVSSGLRTRSEAISTSVSLQVTQQGHDMSNMFHTVTHCINSATVESPQVLGRSQSDVQLDSPAESSCNQFQMRPGLESARKLLAKEEVRPEGLKTPPPASDALPKSSLKHYCSPSEARGGLQTKHIKVTHEMDVYDHMTKKYFSSSNQASSTVTCSLSAGGNSPSASMDSTDLSSLLSQVAFSDSGFVSDCSTADPGLSQSSSLSKLKISSDPEVTEDGGLMQCLMSDSDIKTHESSLSDLDLLLSGVESPLSVSMGDLLWTPPTASLDSDSYLTSTPFREGSMTPVAGECDFVTPTFSESRTSTPLHCATLPGDSASTSEAPRDKDDHHWQLPDNYIIDEGVDLDINFSAFE